MKNLQSLLKQSVLVLDEVMETMLQQEAFLISISYIPVLSIGLNCALGADQLKPYLQHLSDNTSAFVSAHPNAGLPNVFGEYDQSATQITTMIKEYLEDNTVNIVGGCCGTTSEHIKEIADLAKQYQPRIIS